MWSLMLYDEIPFSDVDLLCDGRSILSLFSLSKDTLMVVSQKMAGQKC